MLLACLAFERDARAESESAASDTSYDEEKCDACHQGHRSRKNTHTALEIGGCPDCHIPGDEAGRCEGAVGAGWKLKLDDPDLCNECHDMANKTPLHSGIDVVGCTGCHDPHGGDLEKNLLKEPSALCEECHSVADKSNVHTAVQMGDCVVCHNPHSGIEEPLLRTTRDRICFECHDADTLFDGRVKHAPVTEGRCLDCHYPHESDEPFQLRASGSALCLLCHDPKARAGLDRPRPEKRIQFPEENSHAATEFDCQDTCHVPGHSGNNERLLQKPPPAVCYECHDRVDGSRFVHGAVQTAGCPTCHNPHGSGEPKLLRDPLPGQLCFRCHQDDLSGRAFVHPPAADGDCLECHGPHGADNPKNLRHGEGKKVCYECHDEKDEVPNKHAAIERYGCTVCHDPHGTANRFFLGKPVNELCQSCHADKMDGLHATTFIPGGHIISGGPDPHDTEREFSCASCHNPHGSTSPKLLRYGETTLEVCDWCHGDRTGKNPELKDISKLGRRNGNGKDSKKQEEGKPPEEEKKEEKKK